MGHLRRTAAVLLLGLPLLLGFASGVQAQATLSIEAPANANEGNSGTTDKTFTVRLSQAISGDVYFKVCFRSGDRGTATRKTGTGAFSASEDYEVRVGAIAASPYIS